MTRQLFLGAFLLAFTPLSATAATNCGARPQIVERLTTHFGETRRGLGLATNNGVMEVYASSDTGSWTVALTLPDGRMCLLASGVSFEDEMDPLAVADADA